MRNAFKGWRNDAMAAKIENRIDRRIVAASVSYWMVRQRGRLLERVRDQRFLQEALEIWRERLEGIHEALDTTSQIVEFTRSTKILRSSLYIWREALAFQVEEYELAAVRYSYGDELMSRYAMTDRLYANPLNRGSLLLRHTDACKAKLIMLFTTS